MARNGEPQLAEPHDNGVFIRLTQKERINLTDYADRHDLTITQTLVRGLAALQEQEGKEKTDG